MDKHPIQKAQAINILIDVVADDKTNEQEKQAALTLIGHLSDDGNDGTCLNHVADSWGACENCGNLVF